MLDRLNPAPLFRGHIKGLTIDGPKAHPDRWARFVLFGGAGLLGATAWYFDWGIRAPAALLSGVALLAGGLLASFGQLSTLRLKLTESTLHPGDERRDDRAMLDETAAHLLTAAYLCVVDAVVLVIGMNMTVSGGSLNRLFSALAVAVSAYIAALFLICLPRLYGAYTTMNNVRSDLDGFVRRY